MAFRGPNKTLAEVCLCTISARPRKSFLTRDVGGQKRKNKGSSRNGKEAARVSDTWSRALQIYNESNARVERIRSTLESQLGPSDDQSPKKRTKLQVDPTGKLQTPSDPDELRFPHFKTLVDMKSLLEFRMKKVGLLHDDSLPDDWFVVGPNENFTLDLSKVQFTPSKIMKILSRVCKGGSNCVGQGAIHFNLSHCFHFERTCVQKLLDLVGPTVQTLNLQGCPKLCDGDVECVIWCSTSRTATSWLPLCTVSDTCIWSAITQVNYAGHSSASEFGCDCLFKLFTGCDRRLGLEPSERCEFQDTSYLWIAGNN